jgi:hypothetical protein
MDLITKFCSGIAIKCLHVAPYKGLHSTLWNGASSKGPNPSLTSSPQAKELMAQWQRPLAGRLPPRVQTLGAAPKTSGVSLGVLSFKKKQVVHKQTRAPLCGG